MTLITTAALRTVILAVMHYEQLTSPQSRYFSTRFILHHDYVSKVGAKVKLASAQKRTRPTVKS